MALFSETELVRRVADQLSFGLCQSSSEHMRVPLSIVASVVFLRTACAADYLVQCAKSEASQRMSVSFTVPGRGSAHKSEFFFRQREPDSGVFSGSKHSVGCSPEASESLHVYVEDLDSSATVKLERVVQAADASTRLAVEVRVPYLQSKRGAIAGVNYEVSWAAMSSGPNKSLEPMPTAVTTPAAQEIAPAAGMAHH